MFKKSFLIIIVTIALFGLQNYSYAQETTPPTYDQEEPPIYNEEPVPANVDPLEKMNRVTFKFNQKLDKYAVRPLAEFYNKAVPRPLNAAIDHFYDNIINFNTVFNDLLQANFYQATSDTWRLAVNTTVGLGGFLDVGTKIGLNKHVEGFGLTMAKWGYENSSYFVIPVLGPSTIRDAIAWPVNYFTTPIPYLANVALRNSMFAIGLLDKRAQLLRFQGVFNELSLDPYVFTRNAYLQNRKYLMEQNEQRDNPYTREEMIHMHQNYYLTE